MSIDQTINKIIFKILIGIVLSAVMIISLLNLSLDLNLYLDQFENGYLLQFWTFSFLLVSAGIGLIYLFRHRNAVEEKSDLTGVSSTHFPTLNFPNLAICFLEGFIQGFTNNPKTIDERNNYT